MSSLPSPSGDLSLGHIIDAAGIDLDDVVVLRHTYRTGSADELQGPADLAPERLHDYTHRQRIGNKLGKTPPRVWLIFIADGKRRSRFVTAYENRGEISSRRTETLRYFDLEESELLGSLKNRLVVEWSKDTINWAKNGSVAAKFPVVEIADPEKVEFPGFDFVRVSYDELQDVITDSRYESWRAALSSVQGIYVITDTSTGKLYVGMANGTERILGRWAQYAKDGHGGNKGLLELVGLDPGHARNYQFSLLRIFGPSVPGIEVETAEKHYKDALRTRSPFGLNHN